jgi:CheY-like chemotaxis protein
MPAGDPPRPPRILLVDDAEDHRFVYTLLLEFHGLEVHAANDGAEGLDKAAALSPDVVVLDLTMPVMDGAELCRRLRADPQTARVPIIVLTGWDAREGERGVEALGCDSYLVKPCGPETLLAEIRRLLSRGDPADRADRLPPG